MRRFTQQSTLIQNITRKRIGIEIVNSPKMELLLRKHALERLEMDVRHARAWYEFFQYIEPNQTLADQWHDTLLYRIKVSRRAEENAANLSNLPEQLDSTTT